MSAGHENWYVYYPAPHDGSSEALRQLRAMQQRVSTGGVSRVRIEERVGAPATPTWMEVYEGIENPTAFAAMLESAVRDSLLPVELTATRRIERFRCL
jgi:hypothetical protein